MKFYTIQTLEFWESNKHNVYLKNDFNLVDEDMIYSYRWMYRQMIKRIKDVDDSMVWLWPSRPDLRCSGYLNKGTKGVLLELELNESQVLMSDFELWHYVLMDIPITMYDDEIIDKEKSWERIFDFNVCKEIYKAHDEESLEIFKQGVTSKVKKNNVKLIKTFIAR